MTVVKKSAEKKLTKYEMARVIGSRALQISMGAPFLLNIKENDLKTLGYNPLEIAKMEYEEGVIPITVKAPLPKSRTFKEQEEKAAE
jgi:DNA-directed RNA polymerase subunit K/omega